MLENLLWFIVLPDVNQETLPSRSTAHSSIFPTVSPTSFILPDVFPTSTMFPFLAQVVPPSLPSTVSPIVRPFVPPTVPLTVRPFVPPTVPLTVRPFFPPTVPLTVRPFVPPTFQPTGRPFIPQTFSPTLRQSAPPTFSPTGGSFAPRTVRPTSRPTIGSTDTGTLAGGIVGGLLGGVVITVVVVVVWWSCRRRRQRRQQANSRESYSGHSKPEPVEVPDVIKMSSLDPDVDYHEYHVISESQSRKPETGDYVDIRDEDLQKGNLGYEIAEDIHEASSSQIDSSAIGKTDYELAGGFQEKSTGRQNPNSNRHVYDSLEECTMERPRIGTDDDKTREPYQRLLFSSQ